MGETVNRNLGSGRYSSDSNTHLISSNDNQEQRGCFPCECCVGFWKTTVKYKTVVSGQTYGADDQILEQIQTSGLNLMEGKDEECCITIVFCPVVSRIGTDAEAAMSMVPGNVPVILVLMHYNQEPKPVSSSEVVSRNPNVVVEVHVFYHDRQNGLLRCEQNEKAVNELKQGLKKHHRQSGCCAIL